MISIFTNFKYYIMWNKINYETGLKIFKGEIDDIDLAIELMDKKAKNKSKEFAKVLCCGDLPELKLDEYKVPERFCLKKVPKLLEQIEYRRIIAIKNLLAGIDKIDVIEMSIDIVSIVLDISHNKLNERKFIDIVGLGVFFLMLFKKL